MTLFSQPLLDQHLEGAAGVLMPRVGDLQFQDRVAHPPVAVGLPLAGVGQEQRLDSFVSGPDVVFALHCTGPSHDWLGRLFDRATDAVRLGCEACTAIREGQARRALTAERLIDCGPVLHG